MDSSQMPARRQQKTHRTCSEAIFSASAFEGATFSDDEPGIVRNVRLCGHESKNNRDIGKNGLRHATDVDKFYEGIIINGDHGQKPGATRSVYDRFGVAKNTHYVEGDGARGDIHFNPKHALADQFIWEAKNAPKASGFSHDATYRMSRKKQANGRDFVESITAVRSVDWVSRPATTDGMFESEEEEPVWDTITVEQLEEHCPEIVKAIEMKGVAGDGTGGDVRKELTRLRDAGMTNEEIGNRVDRSAGVISSIISGEIANPPESLLTALRAIKTPKKKEGGKMTEEVKELEALRAENVELKAAKEAAERSALIVTELEGVKIGEATRKVYSAIESVEDRKAFLTEYKESTKVEKSTESVSPFGAPVSTTSPATAGGSDFFARFKKGA